jgi:hypothetical protein
MLTVHYVSAETNRNKCNSFGTLNETVCKMRLFEVESYKVGLYTIASFFWWQKHAKNNDKLPKILSN